MGFKQILYSLPIVLYDRTPQGKCNPTSKQAEFVKVFENIIKQCKEWLVENGGKTNRPGLKMAEIKKFGSVLYFKKRGRREHSESYGELLTDIIPEINVQCKI